MHSGRIRLIPSESTKKGESQFGAALGFGAEREGGRHAGFAAAEVEVEGAAVAFVVGAVGGGSSRAIGKSVGATDGSSTLFTAEGTVAGFVGLAGSAVAGGGSDACVLESGQPAGAARVSTTKMITRLTRKKKMPVSRTPLRRRGCFADATEASSGGWLGSCPIEWLDAAPGG